jgi:hypothetical protein
MHRDTEICVVAAFLGASLLANTVRAAPRSDGDSPPNPGETSAGETSAASEAWLASYSMSLVALKGSGDVVTRLDLGVATSGLYLGLGADYSL